jgi:hypothetical protein
MTDTNALITRLEVIAKRYALDEVKEAAARIAALEAALKQMVSALENVTMDEGSRVYTSIRPARAALGEKE